MLISTGAEDTFCSRAREPKSPGVEMLPDSAFRIEPTPVSSVAEPPIGRSFEDWPGEPWLAELPP